MKQTRKTVNGDTGMNKKYVGKMKDIKLVHKEYI